MLLAQAPTTQWQRSLGGSGTDAAQAVFPANDGGYFIAGQTNSNDGDVKGQHGGGDFWLIKIDNNGATQWQRCLGGTQGDFAECVHATSDGGCIIAGGANSNDGDVTGQHGGGAEGWVVKLNKNGVIEWQRCLGGRGSDGISAIDTTSDGGFIIAGVSNISDGDVSGVHGDGEFDFWVIKLSSTGIIQWQRCLGGTSGDSAESIKSTADGGYIVAGFTNSNDGDVKGQHGSSDGWVIKLDKNGVIQWQHCLGGTGIDRLYSVKSVSKDGYVVAGYTESDNGDVKGHHPPGGDFWVVKLDINGAIQWQRCLGGYGVDIAYSIQTAKNPKDGYLVTGYTSSDDEDVKGRHGNWLIPDVWVVKLDTIGKIQWQRCLGGTGSDIAKSVESTSDGGYVIAGYTASKDEDVNGQHGNQDCWVVKLTGNETLVEHFHQLLQNNAFKNRKLLSKKQDYLLCADGSDASVFKVSGGGRNYINLNFRIKEYPIGADADTLLSGRFTIISRNADSLLVRYRHPGHFETNSANPNSFTNLTLELIDSNKPMATIIESFSLTVRRAPVIMVHGLWSGSEAFIKLEQRLLESKLYNLFFLKRVDYASTAGREFSTNVPKISDAINDRIDLLRQAGVASGKVDYIGHSMGGILGRLYLQSTNFRRDIHKFITLNTPHSGSQVANWIIANESDKVNSSYCNNVAKGFLCNGGAVNDLQVDSPAIRDLNSIVHRKRNFVPSHAVVTTGIVEDIPNAKLTLYTIPNGMGLILQGLIQQKLNSIFDGQANDLIVAAVSQRGGLIGDQWSLIENQVHTGSPENEALMQQVLFLLIRSPLHSSFSQTGFNPIELQYKPVPKEPSSNTSNTTVAITSPARGAQISPGTMVNISAKGNGISSIRTIIRYSDDSIYVANEINSTVNYSVQVGTKLGKREIIVIGRTELGAVIADTSYFFVGTGCLPVNVIGNTIICGNSSTTLTANVTGGIAPYSFQWKQGTMNVGTNNVSFITSTTGIYSVQVTDSKGCQSSSSPVNITSQALPSTPTIMSSYSAITSGGSIQLQTTVAPDQSIQWLLNNTAITGATQTTYTATQGGNYSVKVTNSDGCSATSQAFVISLVTGLDEPIIDKDFTVSALPNPSSDKIEVLVRTQRGKFVTMTLSLHDLAGRNVYQKNIKVNGVYTERIDTSHQPSGLYILNVATDNQQISVRLIKQ